MWRLFLILTSCWLITSCKKDRLLTSGSATIQTTVMQLKFDTIFTAAGSITQSFRILNDNNQRIRLSSIHLAGGSESVFNINVNGEAGPLVGSVELDAGDSAHVFVNLRIPESQHDLPFLIEDSISIQWNGQEKWIKLEAYGQNAHYINNGIIKSATTWNNELPYVLLGPLTIEENAVLQINKGCRIYAHADAPILVYGTLLVAGDSVAADRVRFTGDRLDEPYNDYPAAWPGIYFFGTSEANNIEYAQINNAYQALVLQGNSMSATYQLRIAQTSIDNAFDAGLMAINTSIQGTNLLITNCGRNIDISGGGRYDFQHCTIAAFSNNYISHKEPLVKISNDAYINGESVPLPLEALFRNCIIWSPDGLVRNEVEAYKSGNLLYQVKFESVLWKMQDVFTNMETEQMITNEDPQFELDEATGRENRYKLRETSPAIGKGQSTGLLIDFQGKPRRRDDPDLGAFEKQ